MTDTGEAEIATLAGLLHETAGHHGKFEAAGRYMAEVKHILVQST